MLLSPSFCPVTTIQTAITDGFCDVMALNPVASLKVGNGTCHLEDAAIGTG